MIEDVVQVYKPAVFSTLLDSVRLFSPNPFEFVVQRRFFLPFFEMLQWFGIESVLDKPTRTKLEQVIGTYIATWSESLLTVEFSPENAPLLTRILIPLETFASHFPALLEGQAERIHSLILQLKERETDPASLLMMQALLQVARLSLPLNIKSRDTIERLSAKLRLLVLYQAQAIVEQAVGCLAALTKASGRPYYGAIHKLASEVHGATLLPFVLLGETSLTLLTILRCLSFFFLSFLLLFSSFLWR